MKINAEVIDGEPSIVLSEVYSGIGIKTDMGLFGIAQRDDGIEVQLNSKLVWTSHAVEETGGGHLIGGEFQSDKYPTTPLGKVPLSTKDPMAQDLLWQYAQRRRSVDAEFSADLETALRNAGYKSP